MIALTIVLAALLMSCVISPAQNINAFTLQSQTAATATNKISPGIHSYRGFLQTGLTYRATVRGDEIFDLSLVPPVRILEHQALLVEWTNLNDFATLKRLRLNSRKRQIVFTVLSDETKGMTEWRWNRTVACKILLVY